MKILFLALFGCVAAWGQTADEQIFARQMKLPRGSTKAETALTLARGLVGKPYVPHTLEQTPENLVCNLRQYDCYTLVENVLALMLTRESLGNFSDYEQFVKKMRYRNGRINGYGSRLHYFLEWIEQAEKYGYLRDITSDLGGQPIQKNINFMTMHPGLYPALTTGQVQKTITESEQRSSKKTWHFIGKNKVSGILSKLQNGDIVAFTSEKEGLDFNHEGFVIRKNGQVHLLHASSDRRQVVVSSETLLEYLLKIKHHSGIVVLRLNQ